MATEIKICGLSEKASLEAAIASGADLVGFIFFEKSPRNVSVEKASELSGLVGSRAAKVAVTVDVPMSGLEAIVDRVRPDFLQLHGSEAPETVRQIKVRFGIPVIKAFAIRTASDFDKLVPYEAITDRFLLDAKAPEGSDLPGGNGVSFDWSLLTEQEFGAPYMLSGGLSAENIIEALTISGAGSIDVSSGVESAPGVKDIEKVAAFIKTVRERDAMASNEKKMRA